MTQKHRPEAARIVKRPVVAVVEDEVLIRLSIADFLRECGFEVLEASNAREAQSILLSGYKVDVVFSDVQMPGDMDGFSLARWLKKHFPDIAIILTSGALRMAKDAVDLCEQVGFISKPYSHDQLADRIKSSISLRDRNA